MPRERATEKAAIATHDGRDHRLDHVLSGKGDTQSHQHTRAEDLLRGGYLSATPVLVSPVGAPSTSTPLPFGIMRDTGIIEDPAGSGATATVDLRGWYMRQPPPRPRLSAADGPAPDEQCRSPTPAWISPSTESATR